MSGNFIVWSFKSIRLPPLLKSCVSQSGLGLLGLLPIAIGIYQLFTGETDAKAVQMVSAWNHSEETQWQRSRFMFFHPQTYQVAAVTIANGGDNLSIYLPLFANSSLVAIGVMLSVFLIMIALWCGLAYYLARHSVLAHYFTRYGQRLVPFVLIGLGIFILLESRTYKLLLSS